MISDDSDESIFDYESDSVSDTDRDECMEVPYDEDSTTPWSQLPPIVLEKIYSFLNRDDRCRMSCVCRNWYNEYHSPNLWRRVQFLIPEHEYQIEIYPEVQFARKYGSMFRHVDIVCKRRVRVQFLEIIWRQLKLFLQALAFHSQLESVSFMNMDSYFRHLDDTMFGDIYESIMNLLFTQNKLKLIEFRNSQFQKYEAAEILRAISIKSSKTLKYLLLDGFMYESSEDEFPDNVFVLDKVLTFDLLINLKELLVDYSQFLENIIMSCYEYADNSNFTEIKGTLEMVKIICDGSKRITYQGILPAAWKYFTKVCPSLRIDLIYQARSHIRNNINVFVVRNMPIKSLDFRWYRSRFRNEPEIGYFLEHCVSCQVNEFLEDLRIIWPQTTTNLARDLIEFLKVSIKLKVLQLYIQHPVEALDTVFTFLIEYRPVCLEVLHITIRNVMTAEDVSMYSNMADNYAPILQVLGLNLLLIVDYNNRPPRRR